MLVVYDMKLGSKDVLKKAEYCLIFKKMYAYLVFKGIFTNDNDDSGQDVFFKKMYAYLYFYE